LLAELIVLQAAGKAGGPPPSFLAGVRVEAASGGFLRPPAD